MGDTCKRIKERDAQRERLKQEINCFAFDGVGCTAIKVHPCPAYCLVECKFRKPVRDETNGKVYKLDMGYSQRA